MTVVATLKDGTSVVKSSVTQVVAAGMVYLTISFTEIKRIQAILNILVTATSPVTSAYGPQHAKITGNQVGFTLASVGAGTTITVEGVAAGN